MGQSKAASPYPLARAILAEAIRHSRRIGYPCRTANEANMLRQKLHTVIRRAREQGFNSYDALELNIIPYGQGFLLTVQPSWTLDIQLVAFDEAGNPFTLPTTTPLSTERESVRDADLVHSISHPPIDLPWPAPDEIAARRRQAEIETGLHDQPPAAEPPSVTDILPNQPVFMGHDQAPGRD